MTKEDLKNYIIDVLGYRDYELENWTKEELEGLIDTEGSLTECIEFNKPLSNYKLKGGEHYEQDKTDR